MMSGHLRTQILLLGRTGGEWMWVGNSSPDEVEKQKFWRYRESKLDVPALQPLFIILYRLPLIIRRRIKTNYYKCS
jgi:hypothetical protein